ncbi:dihydroorotase, homodimeric type [Phytophthora cinnamomi]|uniref:dihydroorotase, homodimeric type n=1 Tax=Phytophthora cinnamomi TaxID=4785 RepID=UPI003559C461|nr:dihydroorotase, homodimeric type [Phytophthora cinnamomi]
MNHHLLEGNVTLVLSESHATSQFARCIVMPNLVPPVTTTERALAYHERVLVHVPEERHDPSGAKARDDLHDRCWSDDQHVTKVDNLYLALETMSEAGMSQLVHARPLSWSSRSSRWWPSSRSSRWS